MTPTDLALEAAWYFATFGTGDELALAAWVVLGPAAVYALTLEWRSETLPR